MTNPNRGEVATPRFRPHRAPSLPASGGAGGLPPDIVVRIRFPATPDSPMGRIARQQIEHHVDRLIALLDALEASMHDLEPDNDDEQDNEDCCAAGDDDAARSLPYRLGSEHLPGEAEDAEHSLGHSDGYSHGDELHSGLETDDRPDLEEDDPGEDNGDREPWLGWPYHGVNREQAFVGGTDDLEQGDDDEPDNRDWPKVPYDAWVRS